MQKRFGKGLLLRLLGLGKAGKFKLGMRRQEIKAALNSSGEFWRGEFSPPSKRRRSEMKVKKGD